MSELLIHGGRRLSGTVAVAGNKNAALPLLAACLLTTETCELRNVPQIRDVTVMIGLLRSLGAAVEGEGTSTLRVTCREIRSTEPDPALVGRLRGSVLLLGALARPDEARRRWRRRAGIFPRDGRSARTCARSSRWARGRWSRRHGHELEAPEGLRGASIYLLEASVTGTETALLAAAHASGVTEIRNAACEPHVAELCEFLAGMGARVEGIGTSTIRIEPPARLQRRDPYVARRLHRGRVLGRRRRRHGRRHRGDWRPRPATSSRSPPCSPRCSSSSSSRMAALPSTLRSSSACGV